MQTAHQRIPWLTAIIATAFVITACPSADTVKQQETPGLAPCLKETQKQISIEWGTLEDYERFEGAGYKLTSEREVYGVVHRINTEQTVRPALTVVSTDVYCSLVEEVTATFLKVQALHSPGKQGRFIHYTNAPAGVYLRAVWNPELQTFQSRDMRALYDKLMELVPNERSASD
jgi:hypothetical protein